MNNSWPVLVFKGDGGTEPVPSEWTVTRKGLVGRIMCPAKKLGMREHDHLRIDCGDMIYFAVVREARDKSCLFYGTVSIAEMTDEEFFAQRAAFVSPSSVTVGSK